MHPVLKAAIDRPRLPRPYGAGHEDNLFGQGFGEIQPVDVFMKRNDARWNNRTHANDNSRRDYRAE